jgi:hypothetical protein
MPPFTESVALLKETASVLMIGYNVTIMRQIMNTMLKVSNNRSAGDLNRAWARGETEIFAI